MNPERWQQVKDLFEAAMGKDAVHRAAFLEEACSSDPTLRIEVEALLKSHDTDSFLEKPAYEAVPHLFESRSGESLIGKRLGPYEIADKIGQGGMGIIYLARDTRLDRTVAIKMLAPKYTGDPQQRERLKREARAAARLSDPGIATVYSFEEFDDDLCIVSEYIPGRTLHQIMAGGELSFSWILDVATQIARALSAAHEHGIVHRDLKPENVVQTESGAVKILDFGLARIESRESSVSGPRLTHAGMFLGTPAYASPEQLLGHEVDRRTDIFSFGIMLYELAARQHPFATTDCMSTMARILESEAQDLRLVNPAIPREFDRIVRRCLKKRPADRYESSRDLLADLQRFSNVPARAARPTSAALGWWQFHQACAGFGYYGMLYPMWRVKEWLGGNEGSLFFFPALIAVGVAANLRLHLWFTSGFYRSELPDQRRKVARWIRGADILFVLTLAACAIRIHTLHAIIATLLMSVAVGSLMAFWLIEPTTAKAAFEKNDLVP